MFDPAQRYSATPAWRRGTGFTEPTYASVSSILLESKIWTSERRWNINNEEELAEYWFCLINTREFQSRIPECRQKKYKSSFSFGFKLLPYVLRGMRNRFKPVLSAARRSRQNTSSGSNSEGNASCSSPRSSPAVESRLDESTSKVKEGLSVVFHVLYMRERLMC